jgi:hypothetical protein
MDTAMTEPERLGYVNLNETSTETRYPQVMATVDQQIFSQTQCVLKHLIVQWHHMDQKGLWDSPTREVALDHQEVAFRYAEDQCVEV